MGALAPLFSAPIAIKFGQIWLDLGKIKILHPQKHLLRLWTPWNRCMHCKQVSLFHRIGHTAMKCFNGIVKQQQWLFFLAVMQCTWASTVGGREPTIPPWIFIHGTEYRYSRKRLNSAIFRTFFAIFRFFCFVFCFVFFR